MWVCGCGCVCVCVCVSVCVGLGSSQTTAMQQPDSSQAAARLQPDSSQIAGRQQHSSQNPASHEKRRRNAEAWRKKRGSNKSLIYSNICVRLCPKVLETATGAVGAARAVAGMAAEVWGAAGQPLAPAVDLGVQSRRAVRQQPGSSQKATRRSNQTAAFSRSVGKHRSAEAGRK